MIGWAPASRLRAWPSRGSGRASFLQLVWGSRKRFVLSVYLLSMGACGNRCRSWAEGQQVFVLPESASSWQVE